MVKKEGGNMPNNIDLNKVIISNNQKTPVEAVVKANRVFQAEEDIYRQIKAMDKHDAVLMLVKLKNTSISPVDDLGFVLDQGFRLYKQALREKQARMEKMLSEVKVTCHG